MLASRRGKKRAAVAIAHKLLIICYFIIKRKVEYRELGEDYLPNRSVEKKVRNHVKLLEKFQKIKSY